MSLPAADDLFRPTTPITPGTPGTASEAGPDQGDEAIDERSTANAADTAESTGEPGTDAGSEGTETAPRRPSGRVRHDEKMTVYVTADELMDLEHARLMLRRNQGLAVDRGRLVREAVAIALADLEAHGDDSVIVRRLRNS